MRTTVTTNKFVRTLGLLEIRSLSAEPKRLTEMIAVTLLRICCFGIRCNRAVGRTS